MAFMATFREINESFDALEDLGIEVVRSLLFLGEEDGKGVGW